MRQFLKKELLMLMNILNKEYYQQFKAILEEAVEKSDEKSIPYGKDGWINLTVSKYDIQ